MDSALFTLFSGSGSLGLLGLLLIEIYKLYTKNKNDDQSKEILNLTKQLSNVQILLKDYETKINELQSQIIELREENAILKGLLQAQENKEELVKHFVEKRSKVKEA